MSDTPRTISELTRLYGQWNHALVKQRWEGMSVGADFARDLEQELNAAIRSWQNICELQKETQAELVEARKRLWDGINALKTLPDDVFGYASDGGGEDANSWHVLHELISRMEQAAGQAKQG